MASRARSAATARRPDKSPRAERRAHCRYCRAPWVKSVPVEDVRVELCADHARALEVGPVATCAALDARVAALPERRTGADRRVLDRRSFPRPEGRRMSDGRRASDRTTR